MTERVPQFEAEEGLRVARINQLNVLTERKWDLENELHEIELARAALFNQLRGHDGTQRMS